MDTGQQVDVVGAGAWGLSAALALLESGCTKVRIWERDQPGSGNTSRAAGLVSTHLRQENDIRLVLETRERLLALREWGLDNDLPSAPHVYHAPGSLTMMPEGEAHRLESLQRRLRALGASGELVRASEWPRHPWAMRGTEDLVGLFSPKDGYVEAGDLVDLLRQRVKSLGATIHPETPVRLGVEGKRVGAVEGKTRLRTDHAVLAAGAWSKQILAKSGLHAPIKPYRTQLAQIEYPSRDVPVFHEASLHVYGRPDGPNRILVGDGTELRESPPEGYPTSVDDSFVQKVASSLSQRLRDGDAAGYRTGWAGLCVATPDRDPLIGPHPGVQGLSLMVGDNGFGVMRCMALGAVAANAVLGRADPRTDWLRPARLAFDDDFEVREGFEL